MSWLRSPSRPEKDPSASPDKSPAAGRCRGKVSSFKELLQAADALDTPEKPRTRTGRIELGKSRLHGLALDGEPRCVGRFGRPTPRSISAAAVMRPIVVESGWLQPRLEEIYESSRREPLGRSYSRGHVLPKQTASPEFHFGTASAGFFPGQTGKDAISPLEVPDDAAAHDLYVKSHQSFEPGERVNRRYAWPSEISADFAFGRPGAPASDGAGVKAALTSELPGDANAFAMSRVVQHRGEEFRRGTHMPVGARPAGLSTGNMAPPPVPATFAFGTPSRCEATAADLIKGNYTLEQQLPDKDLGCCIQPGRRNVTEETRPFGKATVSELHQQEVRQLLSPDYLGQTAISREELTRPRSAEEVRTLISAVLGDQAAGIEEMLAALQSLDATLSLQSVICACTSSSAPVLGLQPPSERKLGSSPVIDRLLRDGRRRILA